jgi:Na+-driven multidrug efflux pump
MKTSSIFEISNLRHIMPAMLLQALPVSLLFATDLLDLYFISFLGEDAVAAAIGYGSVVLFMVTSLSLALSWQLVILLTKAVEQPFNHVKQTMLVYTCGIGAIGVVLMGLLWGVVEPIFVFFGATDAILAQALAYIMPMIWSTPLVLVSFALVAILKSIDDMKMLMQSLMLVSLVHLILEPLFIFSGSMGVAGAAWAAVTGRVLLLLLLAQRVFQHHALWTKLETRWLRAYAQDFVRQMSPALLISCFMPIGHLILTHVIAGLGSANLAVWALIYRLIPLVFVLFFTQIGVNHRLTHQYYVQGYCRQIRRLLQHNILLMAVYTMVAMAVLNAMAPLITTWFHLSNTAAETLVYFCRYLTPSLFFMGLLLLAYSVFNGLQRSSLSTVFSIAYATVGVVPGVYVGLLLYGMKGVLLAYALGTCLFALLAMGVVYYLLNLLEKLPVIHTNEDKLMLHSPYHQYGASAHVMLGQGFNEDGAWLFDPNAPQISN